MDSDNKKKKPSFDDVLNRGASVDKIFEDAPIPKGTDPFEKLEPVATESVTISPLAVEEASADFEQIGGATPVNILDNDTLFCVNRKFAALEELFRLVGRDCTFGELTSEILRIAMEHVKSEAGSIVEIDFENNNMFFRAVSGRSSKNLLTFTIPRGKGVVGFVCENQQVMALSKVDESSVYLKTISDSVGFETRNIVAYPLVIRAVTFGCLELLNRLGEDFYTDADKEVLATICEFAAKVIEQRLVLAAVTKELIDLRKLDRGEAA